jgi:hypothetical protein
VSRGGFLALGLLAAALAAVGAYFLLGQQHPSPGPLASATPTASATPMIEGSPTPGPKAGPQASPGSLGAALDDFLGAVPVKVPPPPKEVLEAAVAAGQDPVDYREALSDVLKRRKGAGLEAVELLSQGLGEADAKLRFQHALALSKHMDGPMTDALLAKLPDAEARGRPEMVFALRGSREARVGATLADLYGEDEDPKVRAQAAYVLSEGGEDWPPLAVEQARVTARLDLQSEDPLALQGAGDVLGIPPLSAPDRELLVRAVKERGPQKRRLHALRALASAKVPAATLAPTLEQIARDTGTSPELRAQIEGVLKELKK